MAVQAIVEIHNHTKFYAINLVHFQRRQLTKTPIKVRKNANFGLLNKSYIAVTYNSIVRKSFKS